MTLSNMKKIIPTLLFLFSLPVFVGCNESLDTYTGENGIYFDTRYNGSEMLSDTIEVHWGLKNTSVQSQFVTLKVKLFGNTSPVDRKFSIRIADDISDEKLAEAGVDYVMPSLDVILPAGQAEVPIEIEVLRRPDLKDNPRLMKIELVENDDLKFLYTRSIAYIGDDGNVHTRPLDLQRVLSMDETFPIPIWWVVRGQPYFGDWTAKKAALICDVMDIDRQAWVATSELSEGYLKYCGKFMYRYLQENPQLDEDGEPMEMGPMSII